MSKCVNEKCKKNALNSIDAVLVTTDGDFACCEACAREYRKQRDHFFNTIVYDEDKMKDWPRR